MARLVLTSWGNFPPTGIFEGTYGDIGSFHGCVNVPQNEAIGHAHYCTIAYRPVLPVRAEYELIIRGEPVELLSLFDRKQRKELELGKTSVREDISASTEDAFSELLRHAQYNHYVYYKFGTCFPIQCSPYDVQKIARLLGKQSILMSGPVKCHSKFTTDYSEQQEQEQNQNNTTSLSEATTALQISTRDLNNGVYIWKPHTTHTQWVALIIITIVSLFIVCMTLVDLAFNRLPKLYATMVVERRRERHSNGNAVLPTGNGNGIENGNLNGNANGNGTSTGPPSSHQADTNNNMGLQEFSSNGHSISDSSFHEPINIEQAEEEEAENFLKRGAAKINGNGLNRKWIRSEKENGREELGGSGKKDEYKRGKEEEEEKVIRRSLFMQIVDDCSIVTNLRHFFHISQSQLNNDILCINGIRCITMSWIIITHTMQYNDWSAFARTREIETHLKSLINQPLFNGSYLVDTFFLVSGLLTSLSSFRNHATKTTNAASATTTSKDINTKSLLERFSPRSYLIGRYLRLTPQIMLVSVLFILLPLLSQSGGPHWYTITGEYSENCSQNWWLNLFYIQAFYRSNEMCNFVCWWISVDMFYHLFALAVILLILYNGSKVALPSCSLIVAFHWIIQVIRHYQLGLPPNLLSTIPQTGAMWSEMTLQSFWTPYAHAFPFFLGLYLGYLMAQKNSTLASWFTQTRAIIGWTLATCLLILQSYSTYFWVIGEWRYTRLIATLFYLIGPIIWSTCLSWVILACQFGYGSFINSMLSCKLFIVLGKASYIVYLSHFLVIFSFFGSQNLLLEPTQLVMLYVIIGNICLSMILGCCLCVIYELPWLKAQKRIMKFV